METRRTDEIVWREDLYPRLKPDAGKIQNYADDLNVLPPIEVNQHNILIDGYHRWRAHQTANTPHIPVIVTPTKSEEELLMLSVTRNAKHGLQLSTEDKRRYTLRWWSVMPDAQICEILSISSSTLIRWTKDKRKQREAEVTADVLARWMRCEGQAAIAEAVGMSREKVNDIIADFGKDEQMTDFTIFRDFAPELYTIWNFSKTANEVRHFGNIPPEILDNLLYYYTRPLDVVFDPFAGGGMTIDVCQRRQRRYYVSDLTPIPARITDIRQWDIAQGLPENLPVPDLVFLDPPYWKQAFGQYSQNPNDLANVTLEVFLKSIGEIAKAVKRKWGANHSNARLALIIGILKEGGGFVDLPFLCYEAISKYMHLEARIQVPYSTQIHGGKFVQMAKDDKQLLYLSRDLMVFKRDIGDGEP